MDPKFWHERWSRGEIGFHQHDFNAYMQDFTERLELRPGAHLFVPLCGKSLDMLWLLRQGYRVTGVEISLQAVEDFFSENGLTARVSSIPGGQLFQADGLNLYCADFFTTGFNGMASIDAVYDRAALVALPPDMRKAYAPRLVGLLEPGVRILLVTLEYPEDEMRGPPFAVTLDQVLRFVVDNGFKHGDGCWIKRAVNPAKFSHHRVDFRNGINRHVLLAENIHHLSNRCMGHRGWHQQIRSLIQFRHEFPAKIHPDRCPKIQKYSDHEEEYDLHLQ